MPEKLLEKIKEKLGFESAREVKDGQIVGLGTGSTANYFTQALAKRIKEEDLNITCVASSTKTKDLATSFNLKLKNVDEVERIDITVDGADYIINESFIIKGAGGALLSEKLLESISDRFIVIVDYSKQSKKEVISVPVEILKNSATHTIERVKELGYPVTLRKKDSKPFITDLRNYILDLSIELPIEDPFTLHQNLSSLTGVVETGLFCHLSTDIWIGHENKSIEKIPVL
ncbi:Ribose-5-phosphate isomerase A [Chlamydiales bacterium SCGC AB-751-O23]|jgi:ribose 5-phosphate isomerase A|nr:Ribose-5-phosphate isomerase A [Chlamydiales bacterium SCGC AB-751-O23]